MDVSQLGNNILTPPAAKGSDKIQSTSVKKDGGAESSSFKDVMGQTPERSPSSERNSIDTSREPKAEMSRDENISPGVERGNERKSEKTPELVRGKEVDEKQINDSVQRSKDSLRIEKALDKKIGELVSATQSQGASGKSASQEIEGLSQQVAMLHFLQKMEDELGVSPDKVIDAFGDLSHGDLLAPPKESMGNFLENLNLEGSQQEKAASLFEQMLNVGAGEKLAQQIKQMDSSISMSLQDKETFRKAQLSSSLETMAQKFFMDGQFKRPEISKTAASQAYQMAGNVQPASIKNANQQVAQPFFVDGKAKELVAGDTVGIEEPIQGSQIAEGVDDLGTPMDSSKKAAAASALAGSSLLSEKIEKGESPQLSARQIETSALDNSEEISSLSSELSEGQFDLNDLMEMGMDPMSMDELDVDMPKLSDFDASSVADEAVEGFDAKVAGVSASSHQMSDDEASEKSSQEEQFLSQYSKVEGKKTSNQVKTSEFVLEKPMATDSQKMENVREIVSRAQFLANRGGGEMKVRLNPEGLGEINLKVAMQGKSLNVEMVASNDDAKDFIEKGLGELKATLASQKINVDDIKVDISAELRNELQNQEDQAERNFQQKFLQEFSQQNRSFRNAMVDLPDLHPTKGSSESDRTEPLLPSEKSKGSKRLNLVA